MPVGRSYVMNSMQFLTADQGLDLDGDEVIDNAFGMIPEAGLSSMNSDLQASVEHGDILMMMHIADWTDPPTPTDPDIRFFLFTGSDADSPKDPSNDFTGEGEFYFRVTEFDLDCQPTTEADEAALVDRVISATRSSWQFATSEELGAMEFQDARIEVALDTDFATAAGIFAGSMPLCTLAGVPFPGDISGSVLDALINDPYLAGTIAVDMDLDGDGLEQVIGDGISVLECIDGDGTIITGRDCPCHPRIVDAISAAIAIELVPAVVLGVR